MGLDEVPVSSPDSAAAAAEKRRKLLGALEKCDEDLKSLKRITDAAVRVADKRRKTGINVGELEDGESSVETVKSLDSTTNNGEQPSPVSVLQSISSPTYQSKSLKKINGNMSINFSHRNSCIAFYRVALVRFMSHK